MSKPRAARLIAAKAKARREGWARWIRSEADERAVLEGYYFDQERADHVCEFGPAYLKHYGDPEWWGKPFEPMEWQRDELFSPLFGWVHDSDEWGRTVRRYRRAYVEIPKKCGKSPTGSYIALYMLVGDGENIRGSKCYSVSTDKEQAGIAHQHAIDMVEASPKLSKLLRCNRTNKNISCPATNGFYRVLSSCPRRNEGWNAQLIVADELHQWYGRELWDALKWAFASRAEPLLFAITTAGNDTESVCYEQYEYAKDIIAGRRVDLEYFPLIYEAEPDDDPHDEETWRKANPSLGEVIKLSTFRSDKLEAEGTSLGAWHKWLQLRLNVWQTATEPWINANKWDAGVAERKKRKRRIDCYEDFDPVSLDGRSCWGGLDLALTTDLSAFVCVFPDDEYASVDDQMFRVLSWFWLPEETAERYRTKVRYLDWAKAGHLKLTPGSEADFDQIRADIVEISETYRLEQILFDPWCAAYLTQLLETDHGIERVEFPQRIATYAQPCKMFERLVLAGRLRHRGNPLMRWCIGNTQVRTDDNGNMRPVKPKKGSTKRIDGTVAMIMGLAGAMSGDHGRPDYYETHDVEFI